jgi:hypothetical protein
MEEVFDATDIIEKSLKAVQRVPVYKIANYGEPFAYVDPGNVVGVVRSYIAADPAQGRANLWWWFYPASNYSQGYWAEHKIGYYSLSNLRAQGVLSLEQKQEEEDLANLPWYERLIKQYGIYVVVALLGAAAIRGYLSRPRSSNSLPPSTS